MDRLNVTIETLGQVEKKSLKDTLIAEVAGPDTLPDQIVLAVLGKARALVAARWTNQGHYEVQQPGYTGQRGWIKVAKVDEAQAAYDRGQAVKCSAMGALVLAWKLLYGEKPKEEQVGEIAALLVPQEFRLQYPGCVTNCQALAAWNGKAYCGNKREVVVAMREAEVNLRRLLGLK